MRLFFAVWLDVDTLTAVEGVQERLLAISAGRPMVPETMHLTLSFVGDIDEAQSADRLADLVRIGEQIQLPAFLFHINKISCFEKSKVAWAGTKNVPGELIALQSAIDGMVGQAGFPRDPRPFRPHITLIRNLPAPLEMMSTQDIIWPISAFSLVKVNQSGVGLPYEILHVWPLTAGR